MKARRKEEVTRVLITVLDLCVIVGVAA